MNLLNLFRNTQILKNLRGNSISFESLIVLSRFEKQKRTSPKFHVMLHLYSSNDNTNANNKALLRRPG
jgi:hypothetical protein